MCILRTRGLGKTFRSSLGAVDAVAEVDIEVSAGEGVLLRGPSGSGKTTLLNLLGLLTRPSRGTLELDGREVTHLPDHFLSGLRRAWLGFIFQQYNLLSGLSAAENVAVPLVPMGVSDAERSKRARRLLDRLGLGERADFAANRLSAGEQQRVAIARALINDPAIILADEPDANLDERSASRLLDILGELKEQGRALLIASHGARLHGHCIIDTTIELEAGRVVRARTRAST